MYRRDGHSMPMPEEGAAYFQPDALAPPGGEAPGRAITVDLSRLGDAPSPPIYAAPPPASASFTDSKAFPWALGAAAAATAFFLMRSRS